MLLDKWNTLVVPDDLVGFNYRDQWLVTNPGLATWLLAQDWEYDILSSLAIRAIPEDVTRRIADRFVIADHEAISKVEKTLARYLLKWIIYLPEKIPTILPPRSKLNQVYYAVTEGCNLRCPYCYASSEKALPGELNTLESLKLIDEAAGLGCREFIFTGGEPMLRGDLFELAARSRSLNMRTNIITNGTVIKTPEIASKMAELFNFVTMSIDGGTAEIHEKTRGKGTFKSIIRALQLLNEVGIKPSINHVATPHNIDYIDQLDALLSNFDIGRIKVMHHGPLGRGLFDGEDIDWIDYMKIHNFGWSRPKASNIVTEATKSRSNMLKGNCGLGGNEIYVNSLGDVYPCKLITDIQFKAGNVRERPLSDIYDTSAIFQDLRSSSVVYGENLLGCKTCYIRGSCAGGCRAYHKGYSGDVKVNARNFCKQLRHQMVSYMWAMSGANSEQILDETQPSYIPIQIKTGKQYIVP